MRLQTIIASILLVIVIIYTFYICGCESRQMEQFENSKDNFMIVYTPTLEHDGIKFGNSPVIDNNPLTGIDLNTSKKLKSIDSFPVYSMVGEDTNKQVTLGKTSKYDPNNNKVSANTDFIPVIIEGDNYHLMKITEDGKKYFLLANITDANNGRDVSWYGFADEETIKAKMRDTPGKWSDTFTIIKEEIQVLTDKNLPSGWILAMRNDGGICMNSKEQGRKDLLRLKLVLKQNGIRHMITLGDSLYRVDLGRFSNVQQDSLADYVMASEKLEFDNEKALSGYINTARNKYIPPYILTSSSYPYARVLDMEKSVHINTKKQNAFGAWKKPEDLIIDDIDMIEKEYHQPLKEIEDNMEQNVIRILRELDIPIPEEEQEETQELQKKKEELAEEIHTIDESTAVKTPMPQLSRGFEGIYISGDVASSFIENAFASVKKESSSPLQQRVLLNPATDTAKLHNHHVIKKHKEHNDNTCEYQLTKPQTCNQYDTPCPVPGDSCASAKQIASAKYYKPYMK